MGESMEPIQFGRYLLVEKLAVGGMAEIFRAKTHGAHGFEKTCVIKRILPQLTEEASFGSRFIERFIDEAKVMVKLDHPKVVQVLDFGEVGGQYFIAMEYIQGIDGSAMLRRCAQLRLRPTTGIAVHVAAEVLDALDYAHNLTDSAGTPLGVVHRDVSPANIFISDFGQVKLGDFGIARVAAWREHTDPGALKGKYGYMAPEGVTEGDVDQRADVFSVGVVLAEMLMIRRLFHADNPLDVLLKVRDVDLGRLERHGKHINPALREILESALARDPRLRYQSAAGFRDALHRYLYDHRLMVRSSEVREFLKRLKEVAPTTEYQAVLQQQRERAAAVKHELQRREQLESGSQDRTVDIRGKLTADAAEGAARGAAREEARPTAASLAYSDEEDAASHAVVGRKRRRRITLRPPPTPKPIPTGIRETGEAPRLPTSDALDAVPEVAPDRPAPPEEPELDAGAILARHAAGGGVPRSAEEVASTRTVTPVQDPALPEADWSGTVDEHSPARVFFNLALEEETGLLVFRSGTTVKEIYLDSGDPEYVASNLPEELFGQYLKQKGVISDGELSMALAMLPHFDGKLGDALVSLKLLRPMEVLRHLTHQVRSKLLDVFAWDRGEFCFFRDKVFEQEAAPLGLDAFEMIRDGIQAMPAPLLRARLSRRAQDHPRAVSPPPVPPEVFRMGGTAREVYGRLDGRLSCAELVERYDDPDSRDAFERLLYLLLETGLVVTT